MKHFSVSLLLGAILIIPITVEAQQDYQKWLESQQSEFQNFRDKRDQQFLEFLQKDWEDFQLSRGLVRNSVPKPDAIPKANPKDIPKQEPEPEDQPVVETPPSPEVDTVATDPSGVIESTPSPVKVSNAQQAKVEFFGNEIMIEYDQGMQTDVQTPVNAESISKIWSQLAQSDYEPLMQQLEKIRQDFGLNDWGYIQLLYKTGYSVSQNDVNATKLFTWFMLLKSGYLAKIGFSADQIYIMFPSENAVYDVSFLYVNNTRYYVIALDGQRLQLQSIVSYEDDYPEATREIDFRMRKIPEFTEKATPRTVTFEYMGKSYTLNYRINQNVIDFLESYPQTELPVYPGAGMTGEATQDLLTQLKKIVDGKPETRAVNILLRFVQTGFQYETDDEQFGHENYLFPEETLFYPASDCEDRSALFAYLVKSLLGLDVVLLDYPGHIATAVKFHSKVERDTIQYNGSTWVVCDPTYIYAEYGMTMPSVKDQKYNVIQL